MNNLKDTLKKYISMSPQTFSYAMIGLSTGMLVFFISHKDDDDELKVDKPKVDDESKADDESKSDESIVDDESKADDKSKVDESKSLPEEDEEQYDIDKDVEPSRMGDSRMGGSRASRSSRPSRTLDKGKSKHGKNTNTRKKGNKKHK
jgi:hypothetical protein